MPVRSKTTERAGSTAAKPAAARGARSRSTAKPRARRAAAHDAVREETVAASAARVDAVPADAAPAEAAPVAADCTDAALQIPRQCTIHEVQALKAELLPLLECSGTVNLDPVELERIDTAGAQLLVAFVNERRGAGRAVHWPTESPVLERAAMLLGVRSLLGLPDSSAGQGANDVI